MNDYDRVLGGTFASLYEVEDSWANYDKIARVIDERFAEWQAKR